MPVYPHSTKHKRYPGETWWTVQTGSGKNRIRVSFEGSFVEAQEYERNLVKHLNSGSEPELVVAPRIKDLILPFLEWAKNELAPRTIRDYHFSIDLYLIKYFGNLRPDQLSISLFNDFKSDLIDAGLSPTTINKHLNYLSSIIKHGVDAGSCQPLTFIIPRFSNKRTVAEPKKPLTSRQLDAIYKHIRPHYRLLFLLMSDQGLRIDEAVRMRVEDVDEQHKQLIVYGKGSKYRRVPFLSDRFEKELYKVLDNKLEGYLTVSEKTGERHATMWKELKRAVKLSGMTRPGVNQHLLRHTAATLMAERGMSMLALQLILGHASITTTEKIYVNAGISFVGDEARKYRDKKVAPDRPLLRLVKNG